MGNLKRTLFEAAERRRLEREGVTAANWPEREAAGFRPEMDIPGDKRDRTWGHHLAIQQLRGEHEEVLIGERFDPDQTLPIPCEELRTVYVR